MKYPIVPLVEAVEDGYKREPVCLEELRTLIKSSDDSREKFWRLTNTKRVLIGMKLPVVKRQ